MQKFFLHHITIFFLRSNSDRFSYKLCQDFLFESLLEGGHQQEVLSHHRRLTTSQSKINLEVLDSSQIPSLKKKENMQCMLNQTMYILQIKEKKQQQKKNKQDFPSTKLKAFKVVQKRRLLGIFQMAKKTTATKMQ